MLLSVKSIRDIITNLPMEFEECGSKASSSYISKTIWSTEYWWTESETDIYETMCPAISRGCLKKGHTSIFFLWSVAEFKRNFGFMVYLVPNIVWNHQALQKLLFRHHFFLNFKLKRGHQLPQMLWSVTKFEHDFCCIYMLTKYYWIHASTWLTGRHTHINPLKLCGNIIE